jgi:hypothetical protein
MLRLERNRDMLKHDKIFHLIDNIVEFQTTVSIIIERQPSLACAEGCRTDGLIMGYLRGKGLSCCYLDSRVRQSFTETACNRQSVEVKSKDARKAFSLTFVMQKYPSFLDYAKSKRKKIDDICDALIYAYMSSEALTSSKVVRRSL